MSPKCAPRFPHQTNFAHPVSPLRTLFYVFYSFNSPYFNRLKIAVGTLCPCVVSSNIARFYLKSLKVTSPKLTILDQINRQFVWKQQSNFSTYLVKCKAYRFSHISLWNISFSCRKNISCPSLCLSIRWKVVAVGTFQRRIWTWTKRKQTVTLEPLDMTMCFIW
jgi:hypothetical protein